MLDINTGNKARRHRGGAGVARPLWLLAGILIIVTVFAMGCSTRGESLQLSNEPERSVDGGSDSGDGDGKGSELGNDNDDGGLVWLVPPTLEYDMVYYCQICEAFTGDYMDILDPVTGEIVDEHYGHGAFACWMIYDEAEELIGFYEVSEGGGDVQLFPLSEFATALPIFADAVNLWFAVDSTKIERVTTDWGEEYSFGEDFPGKCAIAYKDELMSGFIFDEGEIFGGRMFNNIIAVRQDDYWGIFNKNGNSVIPFMLDQAITIDDGSAFAKLDGKYGILQVSQG